MSKLKRREEKKQTNILTQSLFSQPINTRFCCNYTIWIQPFCSKHWFYVLFSSAGLWYACTQANVSIFSVGLVDVQGIMTHFGSVEFRDSNCPSQQSPGADENMLHKHVSSQGTAAPRRPRWLMPHVWNQSL